MADLDGTYWHCMRHRRVEPYHGCENAERIGPFDTVQAAEKALETIAEREKRYDAEDSAWEDGD